VSQVCTSSPAQSVEPGEQATHEPERHTGIAPEHVVPGTQVPVLLHFCVVVPLHPAWPGAHIPVQAPLTHVEFEQADTPVQVPFALHDCGVLFEQRV
jgi:hypothetical protein